MSLTTGDLNDIRTIVRDEVHKQVQPLEDKIDGLDGRLQSLENDIKELYKMISRLEKEVYPDKEFQQLSVERRLLKLNRNLLITAKEAGVTLPR